jgi:Skp family chaperone for outer membrane proteins
MLSRHFNLFGFPPFLSPYRNIQAQFAALAVSLCVPVSLVAQTNVDRSGPGRVPPPASSELAADAGPGLHESLRAAILWSALPVNALDAGGLQNRRIAIINTVAFDDRKTGIKRLVELERKVDAEFTDTGSEARELNRELEARWSELLRLNAECRGECSVLSARSLEYEKLQTEFRKLVAEAKAAYDNRQASTTKPLRLEIQQALGAYGKANQLNVIFDAAKIPQSILYVGSGVDITGPFVAGFNDGLFPLTQAPTVRVMVVDTNAFYDKKTGISLLVNAAATVDTEFQERRNELRQLDEEIQTRSTKPPDLPGGGADTAVRSEQAARLEILKADRKRKSREIDSAYAKRRAELLAPIDKLIGGAIEKFASERGFILVLDKACIDSGFVIVEPGGVDATASFIAEFNELNQ